MKKTSLPKVTLQEDIKAIEKVIGPDHQLLIAVVVDKDGIARSINCLDDSNAASAVYARLLNSYLSQEMGDYVQADVNDLVEFS